MDKIFRKDTITLIGPGGVGKSLIAKALSKKTGLPIISVDKIFHYVCKDMLYNFNGHNHQKAAKKIKASYLSALTKEKDPALKQKQLELVEESVEEYLRYAKMFAGFKSFYDITNWREDILGHIVEPSISEILTVNQMYIINMLEIIFDKVDSPVIFDMGAPFGWFSPLKSHLNLGGYQINLNELNKQMAQIMSTMGMVVLIEPGEDYKIRRPEKSNYYNSHLVSNIGNYYNCADICVSSNGLFYSPEDSAFGARLMFDAKSKQKRENLMKLSDLHSICDLILEEQTNLNSKNYE